MKVLNRFLKTFGWNVRQTINAARGFPFFVHNYLTFKKQNQINPQPFQMGDLYPCLTDRFAESGSANGHYFYQDLWVAQRIYAEKPLRHLDVGSRLDGFVTHVAAFRPVQVLDVRPLTIAVPNIDFIQADLTATLPDSLVNAFDSVSCLHALEHFGLGRYGDPVNHLGHLLGFQNLTKILKKNGKLYLSVPISAVARVEFDGQRVFSVPQILDLLTKNYRLDNFSYIDSNTAPSHFFTNLDLTQIDPLQVTQSFNCDFGCGIFEATKISD